MKVVGHIVSWMAVGFVALLALLPLRLLLVISRGVAFFLGRVVRYRRRVVTENLGRAFPEKSPEEIAVIRDAFYVHLTDTLMEAFSLLWVSRRALHRRCRPSQDGLRLMEEIFREGRSVLVLVGHFGNWEYMVPYIGMLSFLSFPVYRPLKNRAANWLIAAIRKRFSDGILPDRQVAKPLMQLYKRGTPFVLGMAADQYPGLRHAQWIHFLNQDTAVYYSPEKLARLFDMPVLYLRMVKQGRGRYDLFPELIARHPKATKEGEITRRYFALLEEDIRRDPTCYLWSHRRWKGRRPQEEKINPVTQ